MSSVRRVTTRIYDPPPRTIVRDDEVPGIRFTRRDGLVVQVTMLNNESGYEAAVPIGTGALLLARHKFDRMLPKRISVK